MPSDWLDPTFQSPFEALKDDELKNVLACAGQWVDFTFADSLPAERIFVYFEREHETVAIGPDVDFSTQTTIVECRYSDFANVPCQGDFVQVVETLGGVQLTLNFVIDDRHEPDEQGAIMFELKLIDGTRAAI